MRYVKKPGNVFLDALRVVYVNEKGEPVADDKGTRFAWLWECRGRCPLVQGPQIIKRDGKETFIPLSVLAMIQEESGENTYLGPVAFQLGPRNAGCVLFWWGWFQTRFMVTWQNIREKEKASR